MDDVTKVPLLLKLMAMIMMMMMMKCQPPGLLDQRSSTVPTPCLSLRLLWYIFTRLPDISTGIRVNIGQQNISYLILDPDSGGLGGNQGNPEPFWGGNHLTRHHVTGRL